MEEFNLKFFVKCSQTNPNILKNIIGANILHNTKGDGRIVSIDFNVNKNIYLKIYFGDKASEFNIKDIEKFFSKIELNDIMKNIFNEYIEEIRAVEHFQMLKIKYKIKGNFDLSPLAELYVILLKIDDGENISSLDKDWMERNGLFEILAIYFKNKYDKQKRTWDLIHAAKFWRKAGNPQKSLKLTENISENDDKLTSALLTVRGASFRILHKFEDAEYCANRAKNMNLSKDYYPYNLLGGIKYDLGSPIEGDNFFKMAEELGSPASEKDMAIRESFEKMDDEIRRKNAEYLLKKNPKQYKWVKRYLHPSSLG